ncbi:metallophosphoesterase [Deinococcus alpinitundrae]|uniref:metallophosphoesterase n=1 Tax=Deinococcus alpinitundrae TaxID=468913 RepID=UPI00137B502D|nr:metallophosphoesterase [Deinococcus alpinitundrae]
MADLHGRLDLLDALLALFPDRQFVFLGDLTDRGADSPGVVARVRALVDAGRAQLCLGNHDQMLVEATCRQNAELHDLWWENGGTPEQWPSSEALHADAEWIDRMALPWLVEGLVLFAHAMRPSPTRPNAHLWGRPSDTPVSLLPEGASISVHGHTPVSSPVTQELPDGSVIWFIDLGAVWSSELCALDCDTMQPVIVTLPAVVTLP